MHKWSRISMAAMVTIISDQEAHARAEVIAEEILADQQRFKEEAEAEHYIIVVDSCRHVTRNEVSRRNEFSEVMIPILPPDFEHVAQVPDTWYIPRSIGFKQPRNRQSFRQSMRSVNRNR